MAKQNAKTAAPKLRFPKFRTAAAWKETPLSSVLVEHGEKDDGASEVHSVSVHKGVVNQIEHLGRSFAAADRSKYNLVKPYDIVYTKSPTGEFPYGVIKQSKLPFNAIVSPLYGVFSPVNRHIGYMLDAYFESPIRTNSYLAPITQKGAKNTIQISNEGFLSKEIFLPCQEGEQQKIADCLTSLDEVIAAQGRKVEALKAHKRGLMQQLFPREGETRPRLRFPEFRDAPDWEERLLGQVIEVASGQVDPKESPYCDWPHVGGENIESQTGNLSGIKSAREDGVTSGKYLFDERDVLFSKIRPVLNKVAIPNFRGICSADIYPIRPLNGDIARLFLVYLLRSVSFVAYAAKHSERGKIPKINREALAAYAAALPQSVEQQRIASCLYSFDTQIAAESNQLAALKTHKQGLMQQLFPALENS